mgnify:CR=1 FL=1
MIIYSFWSFRSLPWPCRPYFTLMAHCPCWWRALGVIMKGCTFGVTLKTIWMQIFRIIWSLKKVKEPITLKGRPLEALLKVMCAIYHVWGKWFVRAPDMYPSKGYSLAKPRVTFTIRNHVESFEWPSIDFNITWCSQDARNTLFLHVKIWTPNVLNSIRKFLQVSLHGHYYGPHHSHSGLSLTETLPRLLIPHPTWTLKIRDKPNLVYCIEAHAHHSADRNTIVKKWW